MAMKPKLPPSELRNNLRASFFAAKPSSKMVKLAGGFEVEVRQPTVGEGLEMAMMEDVKSRILRMFTDHVYVPGTDEKVFDDSDAEILMQQPNAGDYKAIQEAINELMDLNKETAKAGKNSAPTPV